MGDIGHSTQKLQIIEPCSLDIQFNTFGRQAINYFWSKLCLQIYQSPAPYMWQSSSHWRPQCKKTDQKYQFTVLVLQIELKYKGRKGSADKSWPSKGLMR